jgi:hypothetical protein
MFISGGIKNLESPDYCIVHAAQQEECPTSTNVGTEFHALVIGVAT